MSIDAKKTCSTHTREKEKDGECCQHHEAQVAAEQQTYEHRPETEPQSRSNHE